MAFNFLPQPVKPLELPNISFQSNPSFPEINLLRSSKSLVLLRRLVLLGFDSLLIVIAFLGSLLLVRSPHTLYLATSKLLVLAVVSGLSILLMSGWYRGLTRYAGSHSLYGLIPRTGSMVFLMMIFSYILGVNLPLGSWFLYWTFFTGGAIATRIIMRDLLIKQLSRQNFSAKPESGSNVTMIYGAGSFGMELFTALRNDPRFRIIGFLDDDSILHGRTLQNLRIDNPARLPKLIERYNIRKILLALPSVSRARKRLLVDQLTHSGLEVLSIPSLSQLAGKERIVSDLQTVAIEDLLGREPSNPDPILLESSVAGKVVLVTGAGGSIGSELCRQIISLGASKLLLLEQNEFALYSIDNELRSKNKTIPIYPILGDVSNSQPLTALCIKHKVQTLFHAAAYKHVPMVESNICAGVSNNILSTQSVIDAVLASDVERLTLISTDKAVRPTNAMGASKRICEMMIQSAASSCGPDGPIMAMVRFGNVLGSSGSVIPLFHKQISSGGPVTVTHPAVTRYFMTIPEAVQLVLQATGMAKGGDLFLLDMGEPVRIADLARQMIELSGLRVRDEENPDGDIRIEYTGLRPGEKLYEELLIDTLDQPTDHPLIRRACEPNPPDHHLKPLLKELENALSRWDDEETSDLLLKLVPEYHFQFSKFLFISLGSLCSTFDIP
jgi:FlaA1/EpsC-like NDP-sugar epimerase